MGPGPGDVPIQTPIQLVDIQREPDYLYAEYKFSDLGYYCVEIETDRASIYRL